VAKVPKSPKIYHITHLRNLAQIVTAGKLWSDAKRIELGLKCDVVGLSKIKERRLKEIEVDCHAGTFVGHYMPFYFCPRSIMLYILHKGNHPDLKYKEGQGPILHLQAALGAVVHWANSKGRRWAFSDRNAGTRYVNFFNDLDKLGELNWKAIQANQWNEASIKEGKQAEFLIHKSFPWELVERIGVCDGGMVAKARRAIAAASHQPIAVVEGNWYY
jgi:hypothetical protein